MQDTVNVLGKIFFEGDKCAEIPRTLLFFIIAACEVLGEAAKEGPSYVFFINNLFNYCRKGISSNSNIIFSQMAVLWMGC